MQEWLSKNNTNKIRAIVSIGIVYAHLHMFTSNPNLLHFTLIGYLCVGVFYFYMGYNCVYSYMNHGLRGYVIKKIKRIYIPYVVANVLLVLINRFLKLEIHSKREMIKNIFGVELVNRTLWYVSSVLLFYLTFYITFQVLNLFRKISIFEKIGGKRIVILSFFLVSFAIYSLIFPRMAAINHFIPNNNCRFPLSLIVGGFFALFNEEIYKRIRKYKFQILVILIPILLIFHRYNMDLEQLNVLGLNIYDSFPPVIVALIMNIYVCDEHINGKILDYIGTISYELYLLHFVILSFYRNKTIYIGNDYFYVVLYTITLLIAASFLHYGNKFIFSKISGIKEKLKGKTGENE